VILFADGGKGPLSLRSAPHRSLLVIFGHCASSSKELVPRLRGKIQSLLAARLLITCIVSASMPVPSIIQDDRPTQHAYIFRAPSFTCSPNGQHIQEHRPRCKGLNPPPPEYQSIEIHRTRYCSEFLQPDNPWMHCSRCKVTASCSTACQKKHCKCHRRDCKLIDGIRDLTMPSYHVHERSLQCIIAVVIKPCIDAINFALSQGHSDYHIHDEIALASLGLEKPRLALNS